MRPRKVPTTNLILQLPGGNEDNDLFATVGVEDGQPFIESYWDLTQAEAEQVFEGGMSAVRIYAKNTVPVAMFVAPSLDEMKNVNS